MNGRGENYHVKGPLCFFLGIPWKNQLVALSFNDLHVYNGETNNWSVHNFFFLNANKSKGLDGKTFHNKLVSERN